MKAENERIQNQSKTKDRIKETERIKKAQDEFKELVLNIFDDLVKEGTPLREAIKETNRIMKDNNHKWGCYYLVSEVIRKEGRLKKTKNSCKDTKLCNKTIY